MGASCLDSFHNTHINAYHIPASHHAERSRRIRGYVHPEEVLGVEPHHRGEGHASIQMNIADVDPETGRMTGTWKTYAICGAIRSMGESDDCINRLAKKDGILSKNF